MTRALRLLLGWVLVGSLAACGEDATNSSADDDGAGGTMTAPACGDGVVDFAEVCDGSNLDDATCESVGFTAGELSCGHDCGDFDLSACGAPTTCGNGVVDPVELCDGDQLAGQSCEGLGFGPGQLLCATNCGGFDTSLCGAPPGCGDGQVSGVEICDGDNLSGYSCEGLGFGPGELACLSNCSAFDTSGCASLPSCGDGSVDSGEVCDGDALDGHTCQDFGFGAGDLGCASDCKSFDETACVACDLPALTQDGTIDVDLATINISGTVTENGQPMAEDGYTRGALVFVDTTTGDSVSVSLGYTGAATYSVALFASTYDLFVQTYGSQSILPKDAYHKIVGGLDLDASGGHNFDLSTISVDGTVSENGQILDEDGYSRGALVFVDKGTNDSVSVSLGYTGAADYTVELFASTYDVFVQTYGSQSILPKDAYHSVTAALVLDANDTKDFDLKTISIDGTVSENGQILDEDGYTRGAMVFVDKTTGDSVSVSLGYTGAADYEVELFASTYDVFVQTYASQSILPKDAYHAVTTALALNASGTKDFDLKTITIDGTVSENGQTLDEDGYTRGAMVFVDKTTGDSVSVSLGYTGAADYEVELFASTYDVFVQTYGSQSILPKDAYHAVTTALALNASGTKDFDLKTITIDGTVTENGQTLDEDGYTRGALVFVDKTTGDSLSVSLGYTGAAVYEVELFGSSYDIFVQTYGSQSILPKGAYHLVAAGCPAP